MPTVKLRNGKVLLKGGKVACSCCATPECCMYPASGLGSLYSEADLPSEVSVTVYVGITAHDLSQVIFEKGGVGETYYEATFSDVVYRIVPWPSDYYGAVWCLDCYVTWDPDGDGWKTVFCFPCLITGDGNLTPGNDAVEDQFSACYYFEWVDEQGARSVSVTRSSLCEWTGLDNLGFPARLYQMSTTTSLSWGIEFAGVFSIDPLVYAVLNAEKMGDQSSPTSGDGEYAGSMTIYVTECL